METNKIPFSIKEYIKDTTRKVVTRDGRNVRILCVDGPNECYPIVGFVNGRPNVRTWTKNGRYFFYRNETCEDDIFIVTKTPTLNVFDIHWRRAKAGAGLPESIIIPDGEEPRFGKCAVRDSYYIPVEELKKLPKDE